MRGRFIVFEGIDGAGKTVQVERLAARLRSGGRKVVATREPTDGEWGRRYRAWARGDFEASPDEVLELFVRDRREHIESLIEPSLEAGHDVVCDRYVASTRVYQAAQGIDRSRLAERFAREAFPEPDLTLWLRVPVAVAVERMGSAATERFERADFLSRVDAEYARLEGLIEIDARGDVEAVAARVWSEVEARLQSR